MTAVVGSALEKLIEANPFENAFVFFGDTDRAPQSTKKSDRACKIAVYGIGIAEKTHLERGLSFHLWRHWFNAPMGREVSKNQPRKVTRHRSSEMTDRCDHRTDSDLKVISTHQVEVFSPSVIVSYA